MKCGWVSMGVAWTVSVEPPDPSSRLAHPFFSLVTCHFIYKNLGGTGTRSFDAYYYFGRCSSQRQRLFLPQWPRSASKLHINLSQELLPVGGATTLPKRPFHNPSPWHIIIFPMSLLPRVQAHQPYGGC
jgi:hypothetical protein